MQFFSTTLEFINIQVNPYFKKEIYSIYLYKSNKSTIISLLWRHASNECFYKSFNSKLLKKNISEKLDKIVCFY